MVEAIRISNNREVTVRLMERRRVVRLRAMMIRGRNRAVSRSSLARRGITRRDLVVRREVGEWCLCGLRR